jgi:hypothetical protein
MNYIIFFAILITHISSCKTLFDLKNYSKSSAKGSISAKDWIYSYGYTDPEAKLADGQEMMIVLTTAKPKHACPNPEDAVLDAREVAIAIDGKLGEMKLGSKSGKYETQEDLFTYKKEERQATVAFHDPGQAESQQYKFATTGKIKITKITPDSIEGAVVAKYDKNHFINGQFKAKICKYGQLN